MILECKNVTKTFGAITAVDSLSFDVRKGEVLGVGGPNGSGKTTLFNVISGLYKSTGDIFLEGNQINGCGAHEICKMGIARTFQIPQLFSTLPVYDNIRFGAHFGRKESGNSQKKIKEMVEFAGLEGKENHPAVNLKLMDKKKTMLAAALATDPVLLMLDEPISGLSPTEVDQFMVLFKKINKELGVTLIIIEHLMRVLMELSDRVMIINYGEKVCCDTPEKVKEDEKAIECYLGDCNA